MKTNIRSYLRAELLRMLGHKRPYFNAIEIQAEIDRRDEILFKRSDTRVYPELQVHFH